MGSRTSSESRVQVLSADHGAGWLKCLWAVRWTVVVKKELSWLQKLSIYQLMFTPTLIMIFEKVDTLFPVWSDRGAQWSSEELRGEPMLLSVKRSQVRFRCVLDASLRHISLGGDGSHNLL